MNVKDLLTPSDIEWLGSEDPLCIRLRGKLFRLCKEKERLLFFYYGR